MFLFFVPISKYSVAERLPFLLALELLIVKLTFLFKVLGKVLLTIWKSSILFVFLPSGSTIPLFGLYRTFSHLIN